MKLSKESKSKLKTITDYGTFATRVANVSISQNEISKLERVVLEP